MMQSPVILSGQEQEYLLHVLEAALDLADLGQLFLWSQGQLQAVLPHRVLVCMQVDGAGDVLRTECLHGGELPAALAEALCAPDGGLAHAVRERWRRGARQPLMLEDGGSAEEGRLAALGLHNALAHGSEALPGGATFFMLCGLPQRPGARHGHFLRLLLPHLHLALQRIGPAVARPATRSLSLRETQVLRWLREGKSNDEIGQILGISALTVKNHLQRLYRVLGASNRAHAVARSSMLAPMSLDHANR